MHPRPPLTRVDFPVSGENVCEADKRGAGPAGLSAKLTGGEINVTISFSPSVFAYGESTSLITSARRRCACEQPPKAALSES